MDTNCVSTKRPEYGVIILGNGGSGKSYLCNMIIGQDRFETDCRRESVTTTTEYHRITTGPSDLLIYNVPGLIESHQETIERNKREIIKAFKQCPISVVIFVWTQVDGRPLPDDIIAFRALQQAFQFSNKSLMFVVNKVPSKREGIFLAFLTQILNTMSISLEDIFCIETLNPDENDKLDFTRDRLLHFIAQHHEKEQRMYGDIIVQYNELAALRKALKEQCLLIEANKHTLEFQIERMAKEYEVVRKKQEKSYHNLIVELEFARELSIKEQLQDVRKKIGKEKGIKKKMEKGCEIAKDQFRMRCRGNENTNVAIGGVVGAASGASLGGAAGAGLGGAAGAGLGGVAGAGLGAGAGAGLGGAAGAGLGGVAGVAIGIVGGPCAIATGAAGAALGGAVGFAAGTAIGGAVGVVAGTVIGGAGGVVAGTAIGGAGGVVTGTTLGGAISFLYKGRKERCKLLKD